MRKLRNLVLAGAAAAALAVGGAAYAQGHQHLMRVALPDGGAAVIHYSGEKPDVTITAGEAMPAWFSDPPSQRLWHWSFAGPQLDGRDIFADIDRQMASQMAVIRREMADLQARSANPNLISSGRAGQYCAETVEMTQAPGRPAYVERHVYGDCAGASGNLGANAPTHAQPQNTVRT